MTLIFPFLFPPYGVYAFRFDRINELIDDRRVTRFDETNFFIGITCPFLIDGIYEKGIFENWVSFAQKDTQNE